ncbi:MAG: cache domain-containing protein [Thermodesulfobacteriota bacterium]
MQKIKSILEQTSTRILAIALGIIFLFMSALYFFFFPFVEQELFDSKKMAAKSLVDSVHAMIGDYQRQAKQGEISPARAKQKALERIRIMRFKGHGYFWINDTTRPYPKLILHPAIPETEGEPLDDPAYNTASEIQYGINGKKETFAGKDKNLFQAIAKVVQKEGHGFVKYEWPRPTEDGLTEKSYPKESYVRLFKPWDWIIGTGIYVDDVYAHMHQLKMAILLVTAFILIAAMLVTFLLMRTITGPINALVDFATRVSGGELDAPIRGQSTGEMRQLENAISQMVVELKARMREAENKAREADQARQALRKNQERFELALLGTNDGIWDWDRTTDEVFFSKRWKEILGYADHEIENRLSEWLSRIHPDDFDKAIQTNNMFFESDASHFEIEYRLQHKDGTYRWILGRGTCRRDETGKPQRMAGAHTDITERKKAEQETEKLQAQLRQSQKMEAIGTLTGGIAHDFNNILTIIIGYTELAKNEIQDWQPAYKALEEIETAGLRARDVVRQLLAFSRKGVEEQKPLDIAPIVKETLKLLRSTTPASIEFNEHISDDLHRILADGTQIHQVLLNLCSNATSAMAEDGGVVSVRVENVLLHKNDIPAHVNLMPGEHVKLTVSDTGPGIAPENLERIFDPYFTTKPVDKGSGLGLSVVQGIIASHGGDIRVSSRIGEGTVLEVFLPITESRAEDTAPKTDRDLPTGSHRILFVDDEIQIVKLNQSRLRRLGYSVQGTSDPLEALDLVGQAPGDYDLLITDMSMPNMTGDRLARKIMKIRPDIKIILCSGYSEKISEHSAESIGIAKYIEKPFDEQTLALAVKAVMDQR